MKLKELKLAIDKAVEYAGDCDVDVEVWYKNKGYRIGQIGQFGVIPDVVITIGEKIYDLTEKVNCEKI